MSESNPPAKSSDLRRRILFLLQEKDRQGDYRHLFQIASDFDETSEDVRDQLDILKGLEEIEVTYFTNGDALPLITGKGKLELEQWGQEAPEIEISAPASENLFLKEGDYWTLKFGSNQPGSKTASDSYTSTI